jgi:hypothetical protein
VSHLSKLAFWLVTDREGKRAVWVGMETLVDWICPSPATHAKVAATLQFVIPTGAHSDFLPRGTPQRPRVRLSVRKAA